MNAQRTSLRADRKTPRDQRGAATLVIVMLLFFVISLTAAYTARNLIFEQRTGANQNRGSQSVEATEAALEWVTAMLNSGLVDDACMPVAAPIPAGATSFRQRFLDIDPVTGVVAPRLRSNKESLWAACQFDGTRWACSCPSDAAPALTPPTTAGSYPAFGVRFVPNGFLTPGAQRVEVNGCSRYELDCVTRIGPGTGFACRGMACATLALYNGVRTIPPATLTASGQLSVSGPGGLSVTNTEAQGGLTVRIGGAITGMPLTLTGPPGTPASQTLAESDSSLSVGSLPGQLHADAADCVLCLFSSVFGVEPATYRAQTAAVELDCSTACTALQVSDLAALNPGRVIWLQGAGGLDMATATDIGSAADPVVLVVRGPFKVSAGATGTVHGLVFADSARIASGNPVRGTLQGALVVAGDVDVPLGSNQQLIYDRPTLVRLMQTTGSFVSVPATWRDFR